MKLTGLICRCHPHAQPDRTGVDTRVSCEVVVSTLCFDPDTALITAEAFELASNGRPCHDYLGGHSLSSFLDDEL
jgi:hypothetical protein